MIKRKILFIKKSLQLRFVAFVLLSFLIGVGFAVYEAVSLMEKVFAAHPALLHVFFEEGSSIFYMFIIKILICFSILALLSAVISNKFAGPVYRFEQACKKVSNGDFKERVNLREGDGLIELQKDFNNMLDFLEAMVKDVKTKQKKGE